MAKPGRSRAAGPTLPAARSCLRWVPVAGENEMPSENASAPGTLLRFLGRNGAAITIVAIALGFSLPDLGFALRSVLLPAVCLIMIGAFLAASYSAEKSWLQGYALIVVAWVAIGPGLMVGFGSAALAVDTGLLTGIIVAAVMPTAGSVPAFAALLNLSPKLARAVFVATTIAAPISMPFLLKMFGIEIDLDVQALTTRLVLIIGVAATAALIIWRNLQRLHRWVPDQSAATGISVLGLMVQFTAAASLVRRQIDMQSLAALRLVGIAALLSVSLTAIGSLLFLRLGYQDALTVGLLCGNRNGSLGWSIVVGQVPAVSEAYLATTSVLVALMPLSVQAGALLVRRVRGRSSAPAVEIAWFEMARPDRIETFEAHCARSYRVGRSLDAEIRLDAPTVSRLHAVLRVQPEGNVIVRNTGSANGIFEDGERVGEALLHQGETVRIGPYRLGPAAARLPPLTIEWWRSGDPASLSQRTFTTVGTFCLGRNSTCDIKLDDPIVSSLHATLAIGPAGDVELRDRGSRNGLSVAGQRQSEVRLDEAGEVQIGPFLMRIRRSSSAPTAQATPMNR